MPHIAAVLNDSSKQKNPAPGDAAARIAASRQWAELASAIASRGAPGTLLAIIEPGLAFDFSGMYARLALCDSGTGDDGCASCRAWSDKRHPDMLTAGGGDGPPGIDDCLALQSEIGLRAFAAKGRLGVVPFADALSLPAANSLLKIAEEPPEGGRLLLLAGEDNLPPTIRSRAWIIRFSETDAALPSPPPVTPAEWAAFLERSKRGTADDIAAEAASWSQSLAASGRPDIAASLANAVYISRKRRMPVSMVQDALWAILWKGAAIGQIFGDLR